MRTYVSAFLNCINFQLKGKSVKMQNVRRKT